MIGRVQADVRHAAPGELGEQGPEPVRMLVVDGERAIGGDGHRWGSSGQNG